jgi:hypothetical protein
MWGKMQNINAICFGETGILRNEFSNLYRSLYNDYKNHELIISALASKAKGLSREEIIKNTGLSNAGSTTRILTELEESGFIRKYHPFGKKKRNSLYQLVDFYSLFYKKFIQNATHTETPDWNLYIDNPSYRSWSGYAFEQVCLYHLPHIKKALGISGVQTSISSWRSSSEPTGAQVDLVIDRRDMVINLCEMKYSINEFIIDKKYAENLRNKISAYKSETKTHKSVFLTMISTYGLKHNSYSTGLVQNDFKMDVLFEKYN